VPSHRFQLKPTLSNTQLEALLAAAWPDRAPLNWQAILERSLCWVGAFAGEDESEQLIGFVYVAWNGQEHAWLLDTTVRPDFRRRGIGVHLVQMATEETRRRGIEWLHVDYEVHLAPFYTRCGFVSTHAGLIRLRD
jgi:GNAT superfamily N-acetyltransferase